MTGIFPDNLTSLMIYIHNGIKMSKTQDYRINLLCENKIPRKLNDVSKKYKNMLSREINDKKILTETIRECQCGSTKLELLTNIDRFALPFKSLICQECGLVMTSPRIKEESLPYYYEKFYHPLTYGKESLEKQEVLFSKGQGNKIFNLVKDFLPKQKELKVLEIGVGTGSVLKEFKYEANLNNYLVQELGTEYSSECIEICKKNDIKAIFGNAESAIEHNIEFDLIILSHVFEHFIDLQKELNTIKHLMTKKSILYIEVPGLFIIHKKPGYNFSLLGYLTHAHMYNFTLDSLNNILSMHGFKMLYGNEEIESIFIFDNKKTHIQNAYLKIMHYLEFLDNNQNYFNTQQNILKKYNNRIKSSELANKKFADVINIVHSLCSISFKKSPLRKIKTYKSLCRKYYKIN